MTNHVLVVDDDVEMRRYLAEGLSSWGFVVVHASSADVAVDHLRTRDVSAVVTDLRMPKMNGIALCRELASTRPDVPVIVVTAFGSMDTAVAAIRAGAYDFITKPFELDELALALQRAIRHRELTDEVRRLHQTIEAVAPFREIIGDSEAMNRLFSLLDRLRTSEASVLIQGETGTGKELIARALHDRGRRSVAPFVALNCAAIPESLIESELFGHVRGAFTDAREDRLGVFREADGGTLFLDELAELPMELQPKLLRALQEKRVRPVGGAGEIATDVRVIAATNHDLDEAVREGVFRQDLFYRINVLQIDVPPLRSRGNDVLVLAQHFVGRFSAQSGKSITGISSPVAERLFTYHWPGNVRELENAMERGVALAEHDQILVVDLPTRIREHRPTQIGMDLDSAARLLPMAEVERRYIQRVLEATHGNKTLTAKTLGFDRRTLYRKLEKYGIEFDESANRLRSEPASEV